MPVAATNEWKIADETVYAKGDNPLANPFYGYRTANLVLPDGRSAVYHGIIVGDIVHALPLEPDLTTHLVCQPRPNARAVWESEVPSILELPGGAVDHELGIEKSANRELCQEIGREATNLERVGVLFTAVGVSDERDHIFLATGLYRSTDDNHDEATEQGLRVVSEPFGRIYDRIRRGTVPVSGQTVSAFALVAARL